MPVSKAYKGPWGLKPRHYAAIYADPPWTFKVHSWKGEDKSPQNQYDTMTLADIKALPVKELAAKDCALFMWVTFPHLKQGLEVMEAWGFEYKSGGSWAKQSKTGAKWAFGTGFIFRGAAEVLLVGTRGKPKWQSKSERNLWVHPLREHSRKPDEVREMIERMIHGPKVELNARQSFPGWDAHGHEKGKFDTQAP